MRPGQDFGVEKSIERCGNCLVVGLAANAEDVGEEGDGDGLALESPIHGNEVQNGRLLLALRS